MNDQPEVDFTEGGPISLAAFIRVKDYEGGDIVVNVAEIAAVFGLQGQALRVAPDGTRSRIALRGGTNIPTTASVDEISELLAVVAVVASGESAEKKPTTTMLPGVWPPQFYTPDSER